MSDGSLIRREAAQTSASAASHLDGCSLFRRNRLPICSSTAFGTSQPICCFDDCHADRLALMPRQPLANGFFLWEEIWRNLT